MEFPASTEWKLGESIRVNLSFGHICSSLNHESGKTLEGRKLRNRLVTHSGIQNLPIPYSERGWAQSEDKNTDNDIETSHYKG